MPVGVHLASWRWKKTTLVLMGLVLALALALAPTAGRGIHISSFPAAAPPPPVLAPQLAGVAAQEPGRRVEVIAQFRAGVSAPSAQAAVLAAGGRVERPLPLINGVGATMTAAQAAALSRDDRVRAVSPNAAVEQEAALDATKLATSYVHSIKGEKNWSSGHTGRGVGVAVVDTGIQGDLADFRADDGSSRVVASVMVNPAAEHHGDSLGHGTHIAGLIAGNGFQRPADDPLHGRYAGVAPDADLISVKVADETGAASVIDVIEGLQWVVDHKDLYNIRVANLSLRSTSAESYKTDPLNAAVEAAWFDGIVVVTAAGNEGTATDAVSYAPANDPYVITVGGVDDKGTKHIGDDALAAWSSRGTTQDGFVKPDVLAPGARLVSTMAPGAEYRSLCPTCIVDGEYFRVGGTSMAAGVVSGQVAQLLQARPELTPDQVKAQVLERTRPVHEPSSSTQVLVDAKGRPQAETVTGDSTVVGAEVAADRAVNNPTTKAYNVGLEPNQYIDPATGDIDYTRASWTRVSWTESVEAQRASWTRASWTRASWTRASWTATQQSCSDFERASWTRASWTSEELAWAEEQCLAMDPTRASWTRASWTRASWTTSFDK